MLNAAENNKILVVQESLLYIFFSWREYL